MAQALLLVVDVPSIAALPALALEGFQLADVASVLTPVAGRPPGNASGEGVPGDLPPA